MKTHYHLIHCWLLLRRLVLRLKSRHGRNSATGRGEGVLRACRLSRQRFSFGAGTGNGAVGRSSECRRRTWALNLGLFFGLARWLGKRRRRRRLGHGPTQTAHTHTIASKHHTLPERIKPSSLRLEESSWLRLHLRLHLRLLSLHMGWLNETKFSSCTWLSSGHRHHGLSSKRDGTCLLRLEETLLLWMRKAGHLGLHESGLLGHHHRLAEGVELLVLVDSHLRVVDPVDNA